MAEPSRLKSLVTSPEEPKEAETSRLKSIVPERRGIVSDLVQGAATPIRRLATAFSGDPELRGLPPVPPAPDSLAGRVGEVATESAMIGFPIGAASMSVPRAAAGAGRVTGAIQNAVSSIGGSFRAAPARFTAAETALGATSGAGGFFAEQQFPDSDAARFVGEIAGGLAPSAVGQTGKFVMKGVDAVTDKLPLAGTAKQFAKSTWDEVARTVNAQTAGTRASERFQRATGGQTPQEITASMDADIMPEARNIMTPAQLSNNPGLLSLERSIINETDTLRNRSAEQLESLNNVIMAGLRGEVSEQAARSGLETAQRDYSSLLTERVKLAALKADESIQRMLPELGAEGANRIAARELQKALDDAVKQERELFGKIDMKAAAPTSNTRAELSRLTREAGRAGAQSIPSYATNLFTRRGSSFLGSVTTVNELRQAQSQLRNIARNNRVGSDPDFNAARIADSLADAITEDLALAQGDNPQLIKDAVDFSRSKNEIFRQGTVGRILRTASDSGDLIPEALTLESSLGLGGARGAQAYDELTRAVNFMPNGQQSELGQAMDSYVKSEFLRSAVRGDRISQSGAETFLRNNEALLSRFPQIKSDIESAMASGSGLKAAEDLRKGGISTFNDPNVSKASIFINKGPVAAFDSVLAARNSRNEVQKLIDLVSADETGEALQGLKSGFMDYVIDKSTTGDFISGAKLAELTTSPQGLGVIDRLFSPEEKNRFFQIVRTAQRLDAARAAKPSAEGISGDTLSRASNMLLGILGAAYGRQVSSNLGGATIQIPSMFAENFRQLGVSGLVNPARRLIVDAMQDEKLFKQVIMAKDPENLSPEATRIFNAWAAGAVNREVGSEEKDNGMATNQ